ncbi:MAG: hypothetical protein ABIH41_02430 [Nanoarchaeota archaeon]
MMSMGFVLRHTHVATHKQSLQVKQLLLSLQLQRHDPIPGAVKGLEGLLVAQDKCVEMGVRGVLVGGLAKEAWNPRATYADFSAHKDVDVMVLDDVCLPRQFYAGVDWWIPAQRSIELRGPSSTVSMHARYFINGGGVVLPYEAEHIAADLAPGLYILSATQISHLMIAEALQRHESDAVEIADEVVDALARRIERRIREPPAGLIKTHFLDRVLDSQYSEHASYDVVVQVMAREKYVAVSRND